MILAQKSDYNTADTMINKDTNFYTNGVHSFMHLTYSKGIWI